MLSIGMGCQLKQNQPQQQQPQPDVKLMEAINIVASLGELKRESREECLERWGIGPNDRLPIK